MDQFEPTDGSYPSTMSSPYFTGTLVEEEVEMFSCSGEYIRKGGRSFRGGRTRTGCSRRGGAGRRKGRGQLRLGSGASGVMCSSVVGPAEKTVMKNP